jgi:hypothetical protein
MALDSLQLNCWLFFAKVSRQNLTSLVAAVVLSAVFTSYCFAAQGLSSQQTAVRWEDIANLRFQIAKDHEVQAVNISRGNVANTFDPGDLLDLAGDEKFLASENYQMASQQWDKAARAYTSAGATADAKKAWGSADAASAAAKRALSDGVYFHMKAKEHYEASNNLDRKINALDKAARNLERLMEIK